MQKNLIYVLVSFLSVALIISIGTNIAYRTNVIADLKNDFQKTAEEHQQKINEKDGSIARLEEELNISLQKQTEAETKLKEKLAEEERIRLEEERRKQEARIAAEKKAASAAAEAARIAAEEDSKKSKAS
ncbi:MAG: hypothetical protein ACKUBY_01425 [Candidatus Moraniibacteriota bacterium]|jgi:hypothetical protein